MLVSSKYFKSYHEDNEAKSFSRSGLESRRGTAKETDFDKTLREMS